MSPELLNQLEVNSQIMISESTSITNDVSKAVQFRMSATVNCMYSNSVSFPDTELRVGVFVADRHF